MVMRGAIAAPAHFEPHTSSHGLVRTMCEDVLDNAVVMIGIVVTRVHFMGRITQSHMLPKEVGLTGAVLGCSVLISQLPWSHLHSVSILTHPAHHQPERGQSKTKFLIDTTKLGKDAQRHTQMRTKHASNSYKCIGGASSAVRAQCKHLGVSPY